MKSIVSKCVKIMIIKKSVYLLYSRELHVFILKVHVKLQVKVYSNKSMKPYHFKNLAHRPKDS